MFQIYNVKLYILLSQRATLFLFGKGSGSDFHFSAFLIPSRSINTERNFDKKC